MAGTDAQLVRQALQGDQSAYREIVDRHGRSVFNLASKLDLKATAASRPGPARELGISKDLVHRLWRSGRISDSPRSWIRDSNDRSTSLPRERHGEYRGTPSLGPQHADRCGRSATTARHDQLDPTRS